MLVIIVFIILILLYITISDNNENFLNSDKSKVYNFHMFDNKHIEKYNMYKKNVKVNPENKTNISNNISKIVDIPIKGNIEKFKPKNKYKLVNDSYSLLSQNKKDTPEKYEPIQFYIEDDENYNLEPYMSKDIDNINYYFIANNENKNNQKKCNQNFDLKKDPFKIGLLPIKCP